MIGSRPFHINQQQIIASWLVACLYFQMKGRSNKVGSSPSSSGKGTISKHAYHLAKTYGSQPGTATTDIGAANTVQFTDADFAGTGIALRML